MGRWPPESATALPRPWAHLLWKSADVGETMKTQQHMERRLGQGIPAPLERSRASVPREIAFLGMGLRGLFAQMYGYPRAVESHEPSPAIAAQIDGSESAEAWGATESSLPENTWATVRADLGLVPRPDRGPGAQEDASCIIFDGRHLMDQAGRVTAIDERVAAREREIADRLRVQQGATVAQVAKTQFAQEKILEMNLHGMDVLARALQEIEVRLARQAGSPRHLAQLEEYSFNLIETLKRQIHGASLLATKRIYDEVDRSLSPFNPEDAESVVDKYLRGGA